MKRLILAPLFLLASCKKEAPKAPMALYLEPGKNFTCQAPVRWKVLENQGGAQLTAFVGPPDGPAAYSDSIGFYFYAKAGSGFASPQDYAKSEALLPGKTTPLVFKTWKGLAVFEFTSTRTRPPLHGAGQAETRKESTVLIPAPQGFYAAVYSAPEASFAEGETLFRDVLDSLSFATK